MQFWSSNKDVTIFSLVWTFFYSFLDNISIIGHSILERVTIHKLVEYITFLIDFSIRSMIACMIAYFIKRIGNAIIKKYKSLGS